MTDVLGISSLLVGFAVILFTYFFSARLSDKMIRTLFIAGLLEIVLTMIVFSGTYNIGSPTVTKLYPNGDTQVAFKESGQKWHSQEPSLTVKRGNISQTYSQFDEVKIETTRGEQLKTTVGRKIVRVELVTQKKATGIQHMYQIGEEENHSTLHVIVE